MLQSAIIVFFIVLLDVLITGKFDDSLVDLLQYISVGTELSK